MGYHPFLIADGEIADCKPSSVLIKAVKNMRNFGLTLPREFAFSAQDRFDLLCAPASVRDIAMSAFVQQGDVSIAFAETMRLLILTSYEE